MHIINLFLKRSFDIVSSCLALIVLSPLFLFIAIAIKIDSPGPVFFKQARRTKDGKVFFMLKFRTMVVNAEQMGAGLFNYKDDPRVTKVGRVLRKSSFDELPQCINVIKNDMSLVGPRPSVTYELGDFDTLNRRYKKRFSVKAGLTGLAQVKGRNNISWDEKVEYDNQYVDEFQKKGILIDIKVLALSVVKVFKKENIYENKANDQMSDAESAKFEEEEVIRIAHLPDDEEALR